MLERREKEIEEREVELGGGAAERERKRNSVSPLPGIYFQNGLLIPLSPILTAQ